MLFQVRKNGAKETSWVTNETGDIILLEVYKMNHAKKVDHIALNKTKGPRKLLDFKKHWNPYTAQP